MFETCQLVIDRPQFGDASAFVYVAESLVPPSKASVATSPVFHPEADPTAHRAALAQLEESLLALGWEREPGRQRALIGARYHRWRAQHAA